MKADDANTAVLKPSFEASDSLVLFLIIGILLPGFGPRKRVERSPLVVFTTNTLLSIAFLMLKRASNSSFSVDGPNELTTRLLLTTMQSVASGKDGLQIPVDYVQEPSMNK